MLSQPAPTIRPGTRLIRGSVHIFDLGLLNLHNASEAVKVAPADLSTLGYSDLSKLVYDAQTVSSASRTLRECLPYALDKVSAEKLARRACEERASRPEYQAVFGAPKAKPSVLKAVA